MLIASVCAVGLVSGLLPFVSVEVYLGGLAAATDLASSPGRLVAVAVAAAVGQTIAKVAWYLAAARSMQSAWVQRKLAPPRRRAGFDRWQGRIVGRPVLSSAVLLASATAGFPPLMLLAVVAGSVRVPLALYVPVLLVGRTIRFVLLLAGVGWFAEL
jgi:membrane protein YqaA with SNARE-associated domain